MDAWFFIRNIHKIIACLIPNRQEGIRPACFADLKEVSLLEKGVHSEPCSHPKRVLFQHLISFPKGFYVFQKNGSIEGFVLSIKWKRNKIYDDFDSINTHDKNGETLFISALAVRDFSSFHSLGLELLQTTLNLSNSQALKNIIIPIKPDWKELSTLLENNGFSKFVSSEWFESAEDEEVYLPADFYEKKLSTESVDELDLIQKYSSNLKETYKAVKADELLTTGLHGHYQELIEEVKSDEHILEVAFGQGQFLKQACDKGAICTGVDISQHYLDAFLKKLPKDRYKNLSVQQGDMTDLKFDEGSFDRVVAVYVLCHYTKNQIPHILKNLIRLLKPNGIICFEVMSSNSAVLDSSSEAVAFELTEGSHFVAEEIVTLLQSLGATKENISLTERETQWTMKEEEKYKQLSWLVKARI